MTTTNLKQQLDLARQMKEAGDWDDLMPMLILENADGQITIAGLAIPREMIHEAVKMLVVAQNPVRAIVLADGYGLTTAFDDEEPMPGELQFRWENGDRADITECLTVMIMDRGGESTTTMLPYDAAARTWSEPRDVGAVTEGYFADLLKDAWS